MAPNFWTTRSVKSVLVITRPFTPWAWPYTPHQASVGSTLVTTFPLIKLYEGRRAGTTCGGDLRSRKVNIFALHTAPQSSNQDIVTPAAFAIHTAPHLIPFESRKGCPTCILPPCSAVKISGAL